jgi:hypothetical protein
MRQLEKQAEQKTEQEQMANLLEPTHDHAAIIAGAQPQYEPAGPPQRDMTPPDYPVSPEFSRPEQGIFFGEMPAEKIARIRQQAAEKFPGATGGVFVEGEMTPELEAIQKANEEWFAGAPARAAEWESTSRYKTPQERVTAADALRAITGKREAAARTEVMRQGAAMDQAMAQAERVAMTDMTPNQFISMVSAGGEFLTGPDRMLAAQAIDAARRGDMDQAWRLWGLMNQPREGDEAQIHPAIVGFEYAP